MAVALTLQEYYNRQKDREQQNLDRLSTTPPDKVNWNIICDTFGGFNSCFAVANIFIERDLSRARQHFYLCGRLNEIQIKIYNARLFDYAIPNLCYAIMSDNQDLLQRLGRLRYKGDGVNYPDMDKMVEQGESAIYCNSIQMILLEDWTGLARNLEIMEKVTLPKEKHKVMRLDFEFYKAILERNKTKIEAVLKELTTPRNHTLRNDEPIFGQYLSMPALGYAKLAWQKGIEVEVSSPLVPKELLPVRPLEKYEDIYGFIKGLDQ
jgi:hypothetical protein